MHFYIEKPGYKVNISLNHPIEAKFGFNIKEKQLCSIIGKAQGFIMAKMESGKIVIANEPLQTKALSHRRTASMGESFLVCPQP